MWTKKYLYDIMLFIHESLWSSGQDGTLSRCNPGFDSPQRYHTSKIPIVFYNRDFTCYKRAIAYMNKASHLRGKSDLNIIAAICNAIIYWRQQKADKKTEIMHRLPCLPSLLHHFLPFFLLFYFQQLKYHISYLFILTLQVVFVQ